jgi:hypothetical protein
MSNLINDYDRVLDIECTELQSKVCEAKDFESIVSDSL